MIGRKPKIVDLYVRVGSTWSIDVEYRNADGSPINLAGYGARMQVREAVNSPAAVLDLTTENGRLVIVGASGKISIRVGSDVTPQLSPQNVARQLVYGLDLVLPSTTPETVIPLMEGKVAVAPQVPRG